MTQNRKSTRAAGGSVYKRLETRSVNGRKKKVEQWYVRVREGDLERKRRVRSHAEGVELRPILRAEIRAELAAVATPGRPHTFNELADWYQTEFLQEPRYVGDVMVAGRASWEKQISQLRPLRVAFGDRAIESITYEDLKRYKADRLATPIVHTRKWRQKVPVTTTVERTVVSVHRELSVMRTVINRAIEKEWLVRNPFKFGPPLINISHEPDRMRILTRDEEVKLLAECTGPREHLSLAIICALDTALRRNEQITLTWACVKFDQRLIALRARNAKTGKPRTVPIPDRLYDGLKALYDNCKPHRDDRVFPADFRTAYETARRRAVLTDVHWHDLRHTAITWMVDSDLPAAQIMKISGHRNYKTFLRYVTVNEELMREVAAKMDARRASLTKLRAVGP